MNPTHTLDENHGSEAGADAEELQQAGNLLHPLPVQYLRYDDIESCHVIPIYVV